MLHLELKQPALSQDKRKSEIQNASDETALGPNACKEQAERGVLLARAVQKEALCMIKALSPQRERVKRTKDKGKDETEL